MRQALVGADIFDGERILSDRALILDGGRIVDVIADAGLPASLPRRALAGGLIAPGFIDLQVNGGGGVMLNDAPTSAAMAAIAAAHRRFGTTGLLPTLITDTEATTDAAIAAAAEAVRSAPGVLGLHLEGPHLAPARRGAHLPALMKPLDAAAVRRLKAAHAAIGTLFVTMAVEQAPPDLIRDLAAAGIVVSLGHSDASHEAATAAIRAGARSVTHLFNAMSQLGSRAPGLVGAALDAGEAWCGIIADGHHVHPATLRLALRSKRGPGRLLLVTDAMATVGSAGDSFLLNGRIAQRREGRLVLDDGTLAGSDIDMSAAVRYAVDHLDVSRDEALRMASFYPAQVIGHDDRRGRIAPGLAADIVHLDDGLRVQDTWIAGIAAGASP
jgi:N-acetylglucosamine-6-phosphate deacetylase